MKRRGQSWRTRRRLKRAVRAYPDLVFVNGQARIDGRPVPVDEPVSFWMGETLFKDCVFTSTEGAGIPVDSAPSRKPCDAGDHAYAVYPGGVLGECAFCGQLPVSNPSTSTEDR